MNREILFRGKRVDNGEWVYGNYIEKTDPTKEDPTFWASLIHDKALTAHKVIPETVGQFTSLTDKKGTKIFEGDILHRHLGVLWKVVFIGSCWKAVPESPLVTSNLYLSASQFNQAEITGNIHDNPTPQLSS